MNTLLTELETTIDDFINYVKSAEIDWTSKSSSEKWSNQEIIGHLIDSAQINLQRFVRCTFEENFKLIYFQNEWVTAQRYQDADPYELLDLWRLLNRQIIRVLANYPIDRLDVKCDNSKDEVSLHTSTWIAHDYLSHLQHHVKQITG
jgi:hypothetical protein